MAQTPEGAAKIAAKKAGLDVGEYLARRTAGLKRCTGCKEWKPLSMFNVDQSRSDGVAARGHCCTRVSVRVDRRGQPSAFKGKQHTAEAKAVMRAKRLGRPGPNPGTPRSAEVRAKISAAVRRVARRGPEAPGFIDGKGVERQSERLSERAKRWRYDVMSRDEFMCKHCGDDRGGNLVAHHRKPWSTHPHLRFEVSNGITLCTACHYLHHYIYPFIPGLG